MMNFLILFPNVQENLNSLITMYFLALFHFVQVTVAMSGIHNHHLKTTAGATCLTKP